jgi:hypothetical protein
MASLSIVIQLISLIGAFLFMVVIFRLIVKGQLREEYSIVWIGLTIIIIVFSIWRRGLEQMAGLLGVFYPPSLLFLVGLAGIIVFLVHLSVVNSRMQGQIKNLAHEIAYLRQEIERKPGAIDPEPAAVVEPVVNFSAAPSEAGNPEMTVLIR